MQAPPEAIQGKYGGELAHTTRQPRPKPQNKMAEELKQVADLITANIINCTKEMLTSDETALYMGVSKSYLYKLTMRKEIPHYKPMGKMCYFNRLELEQWLQSNRVATDEELSQKAAAYCLKKGGNK